MFAFLDSQDYTPLSLRITGRSLVYMAVGSVVYSALLIFRERCVLLSRLHGSRSFTR